MLARREAWVSPPLVGREAPPAWRAVWRFRLGALVVLALLVLLVVLGYRALSGTGEQDPGVGARPPVSPAAGP